MFIEGIIFGACLVSCSASDGQIHDGLLAGFDLSDRTRIELGDWENSQHHDSAAVLVGYDPLQFGPAKAGVLLGTRGLIGARDRVRVLPVAGIEASAILIQPGLFGHVVVTRSSGGIEAVFSIGYSK